MSEPRVAEPGGGLDEITLDALTRVRVEPGDVLVLRFDSMLSSLAVDRVRTEVERALPGVRCMVLERGQPVAVLTPPD